MTGNEIIEHHDRALAAYLCDVNQKGPAHFARERAPYVDVLNAGKEYFIYMSYVLEEMDASAGPDQPMILYVQAAGMLDAMLVCLWNGSIAPAFSLLRGLFEIEIALTLIMEKDIEARSRLYSEYEYVARRENLHNMQELVNKGLFSQARFDADYPIGFAQKIEADYDSVKGNYNQNRPHHWAWDILRSPRSTANWNPSIKFICEHLGRLHDYHVLYFTLSTVAHAGSRSRIALSTSDGSITPGPVFSDMTNRFVVLGLGFAHKALVQMATYLPNKFDDHKLYSLTLLQRAISLIPGESAAKEEAKTIITEETES